MRDRISANNSTRTSTRSRAFSIGRFVASLGFVLVPPALALGAFGTWTEYEQIEQKMLARAEGGERWDAPARIWSDTYRVYPGLRIDTQTFKRRIERLGYRSGSTSRRGTYSFSRSEGRFDIYLNEFNYPDRREAGRLIKMRLDEAGRIISIREGDREIADFELEPALLSSSGRGEYQHQQAMRLEDFPPLLVRAVLTVEDERFFDHAGVDVRGLSDALAMDETSGEGRRGTATITQQLMNNYQLTDQRSVGRSVRDAALALVAESRLSKGEILDNYLNEVFMGQNGPVAIRGMGEASRHYFGRDVKDLTVGQIATLAGVVDAPSYYSPHAHPERAVTRRDLVLSELAEHGDIDEKQYELALNEPMEVAAFDTDGMRAPYFVDFVSREMSKRFPSRVLTAEGYQVFTTLDPEMQAIAESVVADNVVEMEHDIGDALAKAGQPLQAALVVLEPKTGAVRAMVGGRDYSGSQFNRAIDMRRMPGSTFKPIVALAAVGSEQVGARHFKTTSQVIDERMQWEWQGQVWSPRNYEGEFYGMVTIREAIEHSLNSAVARIAKDVGVKPIRDLAVRMGMTSDLAVYPSIVLGGFPVPLLDMAKVFSVFATGGMKVTPMSVHEVTDNGGQTIASNSTESHRIVPATDAYLVTHLLEGVMERGTGATARRKGFKHPAAGKTGTSNDYKDAWFVGFTPNLLAAVWVGFDEPATMGLAGSEAALPIWTDFMRQALADTPHDSFDIPPGIVLVDVDKKNGLIARPECPKQVREAFLAGEEPHQSCNQHGGEWR